MNEFQHKTVKSMLTLKQPEPVVLDEVAVKIAVKVIKLFEGVSLRAYPDPASELAVELRKHSILQKFIDGQLELPPYLRKLSGEPYTIGFGATGPDIKEGTQWTLEQATSDLERRVRELMLGVLKVSPKLSKAPPQRLAAIVSLAYNIGLKAFSESTCCKRIAADDHTGAAVALQWFNKAGGKVLKGLVNRRKVEADLYLSI